MASTGSDPVPVSPLQNSNRSKQLQDAFAARFKQEPAFYIRVPGR